MKSTSELTDFYYKELYPSLEHLEKTRTQILSQLKWYGGMGVVIFLLTAIWMGKNFGLFHPLMMGIVVGFIALAGMTYRFMTQGYPKILKKESFPLLSAPSIPISSTIPIL